MFERGIYLWNAVDVVGTTGGLTRRGLVVDVKETGLMIDFAVQEKQPEFICYKNVHFDSGDCLEESDHLFDDYDLEHVLPGVAAHEVLFRLSPSQPWMWYPAVVLAGTADTYLLVDLQMPDGERVRRVFRPNRVYKLGLSSKPARRVRRSEFIQEDVEMPDKFEFSEELIVLWKERFPKTHPVGIVGNRFLYIQRRSDDSPDTYCFSTDQFFTSESERAALRTSRSKRKLAVNSFSARKKLHKATITDENHMSCDGDLQLDDLPPEIHAEILSFLDIQQGYAAGHVCRLWHSLLTTPKRRSGFVINLDLPQEGDGDAWYRLAVVVLQRFQKDTNLYYVAITGNKNAYGISHPVSETISLLNGVLERKAQLPVFYMANITVNRSYCFVETGSLCTLSHRFRSFTLRLISKNICIPYLFGPYGYTLEAVAPYDITPIPYAAIDVENSTTELLDVVEKAALVHCGTDKPCQADMDLVSNWIRSADRQHNDSGIASDHWTDITAAGRTSDKCAILFILKRWQPNDRRFRSGFLWENVRAAKLYRNLKSLRKSTLLAMICSRKLRMHCHNYRKDDSESDRSTEDDIEQRDAE